MQLAKLLVWHTDWVASVFQCAFFLFAHVWFSFWDSLNWATTHIVIQFILVYLLIGVCVCVCGFCSTGVDTKLIFGICRRQQRNFSNAVNRRVVHKNKRFVWFAKLKSIYIALCVLDIFQIWKVKSTVHKDCQQLSDGWIWCHSSKHTIYNNCDDSIDPVQFVHNKKTGLAIC